MQRGDILLEIRYRTVFGNPRLRFRSVIKELAKEEGIETDRFLKKYGEWPCRRIFYTAKRHGSRARRSPYYKRQLERLFRSEGR
jgi:hypothetical protein